MANDDLIKQIQKVVKDEIRSVKEIVEILKNKVEQIELFQNVTMNQTRTIKDQQSVMNEKLTEMQETLDANTASVITIEKEIKGYGDMYKINDSNIRKIQKRLEPLEKEAGVEVPPEFQLGSFA